MEWEYEMNNKLAELLLEARLDELLKANTRKWNRNNNNEIRQINSV